MAARLASVAQHQTAMGIVVILPIFTSFAAFVLAIALYAITRTEHGEVALLGFACRVGEGVINALPVATLGLLWLGSTRGSSS